MQKLQQNLQYLCEEFVQLVPLKGTTTGADILKDVLECLEENKLDLKKLVSVTKDGAPAMVGMRKGFVSLLEKYIKEPGFQNQIIKIRLSLYNSSRGTLCQVFTYARGYEHFG